MSKTTHQHGDLQRLLMQLHAAYPDDGTHGMTGSCSTAVLHRELHRLFQLDDAAIRSVIAHAESIVADTDAAQRVLAVRHLALAARLGSEWGVLHERLSAAVADGFAVTREYVPYDQSVHDGDLVYVICLRRALAGCDDELHPRHVTTPTSRIHYAVLWSIAKLWSDECGAIEECCYVLAAECAAERDCVDVYLAGILALFCLRLVATPIDPLTTLEQSAAVLGRLASGAGDLVSVQLAGFVYATHLPRHTRLHLSLIMWHYLISHEYLMLPLLIRRYRAELIAYIPYVAASDPVSLRIIVDVFQMMARRICNTSAFLEKEILARVYAAHYPAAATLFTPADWVVILCESVTLAAELTTEADIGEDARTVVATALQHFFSCRDASAEKAQLAEHIVRLGQEHDRIGATLRNRLWLRELSHLVPTGIASYD